MARYQGIRIDALLLDLDDTLLDGQAGVEETWAFAAGRLAAGIGEEPQRVLGELRRVVDWYWGDDARHRVGRNDLLAARREILGRALAAFGRDDDALVAEVAQRYSERRNADLVPLAGAFDALAALRKAVPALGLITNGAAGPQRAKIDRFELAPWFDVIVVEGEFGVGKPDARVYEHALDAVGVAPESALMVGDNHVCDVVGALEAGLHAAWINKDGRPAPAAPRSHASLASVTELVPLLES